MVDGLLAIYERDEWTCVCGNSVHIYGTPQIAHRLSQSKVNLKKWGAEVIHHPVNLRAVCSLKCNASVATHDWRQVLKEIEEYEQDKTNS